MITMKMVRMMVMTISMTMRMTATTTTVDIVIMMMTDAEFSKNNHIIITAVITATKIFY